MNLGFSCSGASNLVGAAAAHVLRSNAAKHTVNSTVELAHESCACKSNSESYQFAPSNEHGYLSSLDPCHSSLLYLPAIFGSSVCVNCLLDSGASHNFVDLAFVTEQAI